MLPAVTANTVEVTFAGTITEEAGIGSRVLLLANPTTTPPLGAAWLNVTVHFVAAPEFRLVGLHASVIGDEVSEIVAVRDAPFRLAVKVAL